MTRRWWRPAPTSKTLLNSLHEERHLDADRDRRSAVRGGEVGHSRVLGDVVRDQHTALSERRVGGPELERHALIGMLAVVHEQVDLAQAPDQGRQFLLAAAEDQLPALPKLFRDHPARLLAGRDHRAALALPELVRRAVGARTPLGC